MVLVDADAVEAKLIGQFEFADITLVQLLAELRIEIRIGQRHPGRIVPIRIGEIEIRVGHQVEEERFHRLFIPWLLAGRS